MTDPPTNPHSQNEELDQITITQKRICDFCGDSRALLYCRADSAKLCFSCDKQVHSTNQLFTKHTRSQLCDACDSSPASILCSTESLVLCQNCDWEKHGRSVSSPHDRRPIEGFTGCPSVSELSSILGFEDLDKKALVLSDESAGVDSAASNGFMDMLVWETPSIVSIDDLIVFNDSNHSFQAMGVPPLHKTRNATCGQYKDEIFCQLCKLAKSEPGFTHDQSKDEPVIEFQSIVPEQSMPTGNVYTCGNLQDVQPIVIPVFKGSEMQWCTDSGEAAHQFLHPSTLLGSYVEESCLVPDKQSDIGGSLSHGSGDHEGHLQHSFTVENLQTLPKFTSYDIVIQDRDSAISRYKEKKKTRRYDKHIRYESRKVRAESRARVRGRFAKMDH